jgi:hypothetical protein
MNNKDEIDDMLDKLFEQYIVSSHLDGKEIAKTKAKQAILTLKKKWQDEQTFKVIQSLVKSGGISDHLASTILSIFTTNGDK